MDDASSVPFRHTFGRALQLFLSFFFLSLPPPHCPQLLQYHGHLDDECKEVVNECIESFVRQHAPWQMGHRLELRAGGHKNTRRKHPKDAEIKGRATR